MISNKKVGDPVLVLGMTEDLDWIGYVDKEIDEDNDMDDMIGKVAEIEEISNDWGEGDHLTYRIQGCKWWWAPHWLADPDDNTKQISDEDFDSIID